MFDLKSIFAEHNRVIDESVAYLVKNKAIVLLNEHYEYTILYFSCETSNLIIKSFGEHSIKVRYIMSDDDKQIRLYNLSNYIIFDDKIYFLLIICQDRGQISSISLTYKEAKSIQRAFTKVKKDTYDW